MEDAIVVPVIPDKHAPPGEGAVVVGALEDFNVKGWLEAHEFR